MDSKFYKRAAIYWSKMPPTINSMLGGYPEISGPDIEESKEFLNHILSRDKPPGTKLALDCGAGIGRVTKNMLISLFEKVDLVDQNGIFIDTAKLFLEEDSANLGELYKIGLQYFYPEKMYDVVWCQWVIGHLKDYDLIEFLKRCSEALTENGVIIIKENITLSEELDFHKVESSVARPHELMVRIFEEAALKIIKQSVQKNWPSELYPVYMYALVPKHRI